MTLLACCTEGKNVYTEIKCHSLLPLDDIVRVTSHPDCLPEVRVIIVTSQPSSILRQNVKKMPHPFAELETLMLLQW